MERKISRNMPSKSRPPLTTRIRASFEGKRAKSEVTSPTVGLNSIVTQQPDPEALQMAVDHTMNSEAFQNAISANLAKLLKPAIKNALDTIQPVVETVYIHEVLLRKTNQSVENLLERLDTVSEAPEESSKYEDPHTSTATPRRRTIEVSSAAAATNLEAVKQLLDEHNAQHSAQLSEVLASVHDNNSRIVGVLEGQCGNNARFLLPSEEVNSVKSICEQTNTAMSVILAQLDQLSLNVGNILDALGRGLDANTKSTSEQKRAPNHPVLSEHTRKVDALDAKLDALKSTSSALHILQKISDNTDTVKNNFKQNNVGSRSILDYGVIRPQIDGLATTLESQSVAIAETRTVVEPTSELLTALQKPNESHATHAAALSQINEKNASPAISQGSQVGIGKDLETSNALQALHMDLITMKENIMAGLSSNQRAVEGLGIKVDDVLVTLEGHRASDSSPDILAEVKQSNEHHAPHATALDGIKSQDTTPTAPRGDEPLTSLEPKLDSIMESLASHTSLLTELHALYTSTLDGVRSINPETVPSRDITPNENLDSQFATIISALESHTSILNDLKSVSPQSPHDEAVNTIQGSIVNIIASLDSIEASLVELTEDVSAEILTILNDQTHMLSEIREADVSDEILTLLHASNESQVGHAETLRELKSATSVKMTPAAIEGCHTSGLESQVGSILAMLEDQNSTLSTIEKATITHIDSLGGHAAALAEIKEVTQFSKGLQESHDSNLLDLKSALATVSTNHAAHSDVLAELRNGSEAANGFHTSHVSALQELKSANQISEDQPRKDPPDTRIDTIITTLDSQRSIIAQIRESSDISAVLTAINASHELLESQSSLIQSIKDNEAHETQANISSLKSMIGESRADMGDSCALVKDLHESTKASHSDVVRAVAALAVGGIAGAGIEAVTTKDDDLSKEILEGVTAVRAIVEKSSLPISSPQKIADSTATNIDVSHTTITTSLTTLSDIIKSEIDAIGTQITDPIMVLASDVKNVDASLIDNVVPNVLRHSAAVNESSKNIKNINSSLDILHSGVREIEIKVTSHAAYVNEEVHNDAGVDQLKGNAVSGVRQHSFSMQRSAEKDTWWKKSDGNHISPSEGTANRGVFSEDEIDADELVLAPTRAAHPTDEPPMIPGFSESDETESASTSAFASPTSPSFPGTSSKGKKVKKEKKEKRGKKDNNEAFVFDPDEENATKAYTG
ncbi:hypothetical protein BJ878DRAFT_484441 [Calycina marina]|uniref:Uncharacterized protein n=1 Tax=Calycina marina TaxID=1763456 RepID=A0A9P8CJQ7_9HELO|nr:hypothetical protein BJ878DRAFT_484441 [Calycina marina]